VRRSTHKNPKDELHSSVQPLVEKMSQYNPRASDWRVAAGEFEILIGSSADEIGLVAKTNLES
jgi:hypothetical protein